MSYIHILDALAWLSLILSTWGIGAALYLLFGLDPIAAGILALSAGFALDRVTVWLLYQLNIECIRQEGAHDDRTG